jgi:hypothetical protein
MLFFKPFCGFGQKILKQFTSASPFKTVHLRDKNKQYDSKTIVVGVVN